jgi:hypothetical protein
VLATISGNSSPRRAPCTAVSAASVAIASSTIARDLLVVHRSVTAGIGMVLGAVDRDHPDRRQPGVGTQRQHLAEQLGQRPWHAAPRRRAGADRTGREDAHEAEEINIRCRLAAGDGGGRALQVLQRGPLADPL